MKKNTSKHQPMKKAGTAPEPRMENPPLFFVEAVIIYSEGIKVESTTRRMFIPKL
jgi:hypothetical protein